MEIEFVSRIVEHTLNTSKGGAAPRRVVMSLPRVRCIDDDCKYSGPDVVRGKMLIGDANKSVKAFASIPPGVLSSREEQILRLRIAGRSNAEIARDLLTTQRSVRSHCCSARKKIKNHKINIDAIPV